MNMKNIFFPLIVFMTLLCLSCEDMYEDLKDIKTEIVYPGKFDTLIYKLGIERVEIELMKAGRIPAKQMNLSKALYTVYQVDDAPPVVLDSLYSWVNVTGLTEQRVYQIKVYSIDEYGSKSIPQTCTVIPYTELDKEKLVITHPRTVVLRDFAIVDWPNTGLNTLLADFNTLNYDFVNDNGDLITDTLFANDKLIIELYNLVPNTVNTINFNIRMIPKLITGQRIIDPVDIEFPLVLNMPTPETFINVSESAIFRANGISNTTLGAIQAKTSFVMPLCVKSFSDLYYFGELEELDLTGRNGLKDVMPEFSFGNIKFGGGYYQPYIQKVEYLKVFTIAKPIDAQHALLYKLDRGYIKKIKYLPNSMGLDQLLAPYVESGIVDLVDDNWFPDEVPLDSKLVHQGQPAFAQYQCEVVPLGSNNSEVPKIGDLDDSNSVIKIIPIREDISFMFTLPTEYRYDYERYKFLKLKVYLKCEDASTRDQIKSAWAGQGRGFPHLRRVWMLTRYHLWGESANIFSNGGDADVDYRFNNYADNEVYDQWPNGASVIPPDYVNEDWFEIVFDINEACRVMDSRNNHKAPYDNPQNGHFHFRSIMFALGRNSGPNPHPSTQPVTYYLADMKFTKNR
jgi:hypothetical protein